MKVDVKRLGYYNLLQDFKFVKSVVKIAMDAWWKSWRKESVYKIYRYESFFICSILMMTKKDHDTPFIKICTFLYSFERGRIFCRRVEETETGRQRPPAILTHSFFFSWLLHAVLSSKLCLLSPKTYSTGGRLWATALRRAWFSIWRLLNSTDRRKTARS